MTHRRIAASKVYIVADKGTVEAYTNHIVETDGGHFICHCPLIGEPAMTEWLGGTIVVSENRISHYHRVLDITEIVGKHYF